MSSILNFQPEGAESLIDFTKQIDPATGKAYTVEQNVDRFFSNPLNNEGFRDKLSPLLDQRLQFSGNKNLAQDDPARYALLQEVMAKQAFATAHYYKYLAFVVEQQPGLHLSFQFWCLGTSSV